MSSVVGFAQNWTIDGVVLDKKSNKPVEFATVILGNTEQWAVADANGKFVIKNVPSGNNVIKVSCLGYVTDEKRSSYPEISPVIRHISSRITLRLVL